MSNGFNAPNPYVTPGGANYGPSSPAPSDLKVKLPAIALIIVGALGLLASIYSVYVAMFAAPEPIDPEMNEAARAFIEGSRGPVAAIIQSVFILVNIAIMAGGAMMVQQKNWVFALVASILACVNIGSCCCFLGLPVGIWSIIILSLADVRQNFDANR